MNTKQNQVILVNSPDQKGLKQVNVSLVFERVGDIDTIKELFFAEITMKVSWQLEQTLVGPYDPSKHWNPKVFIENMFVKPDQKVQYEVKGNEIIETQKIKASFWERLEIANFPLDIQELSIVVTSELSDVRLIASNYFVKYKAAFTFVEQQRWTLFHYVDATDKARYDDYEKNEKNKRSKISFTAYCKRKSRFYFLNAFFLIFIITITSLNIFSVDTKAPQNRIAMSISLLLTSVSFKWVYNRSLPTVNYLTSLDLYSLMHILFICLLAVWFSIIGSYWPDKTEAKQIDLWALLAFAILFVCIQLYFVIRFTIVYVRIREYEKREKDFLAFHEHNSEF